MVFSPSLSMDIPPLGEPEAVRHDLLDLGTALLEEDMEDFLCKFPHRLSDALDESMSLASISRQFSISQGRPDIIAKDAYGHPCVIECKRGPLRRSHLGQLIEYFRPNHGVLAGARLILLLNSANSTLVEKLKFVGIQVNAYSYQSVVKAMVEEGYEPISRNRGQMGSGAFPLDGDLEPEPMTAWKRGFLSGLKAILPPSLHEVLSIQTAYKPEKKVRVSRRIDDLSVLYVASNAGRVEFGLPLIHHFLLAGVPIQVMKTKGPAVFLSKGGRVPTITIELKADAAVHWLGTFRDAFIHGIENFDEGLDPAVITHVLRHLGATIQDSNASKLQASGVCQSGPECPYCNLPRDKRVE